MRASSTAATRGDDQNSEERNDATEEPHGSPANNELEGSPGSQEGPLDSLLTSDTHLFPSYLQDNPWNFSGQFAQPDLGNLSEIIDLDTLLPNAQDLLHEMQDDNIGEFPPLVPEPPRPSLPDFGHNGGVVGRTCTLVVGDDKFASALANIAKYPAHILASLRLRSKYAMQRFVKAFFEHVSPHIPVVHEPTFDIATVPCKSHDR